jgi:MFS transporter, FHS family, glucose/mannose:H+ symporter
MPTLAFASNLIWVLVIGLLGPSLPAMVTDLGISYAQAGFFFTLLSLGSLFGTSLGAIGSDYLSRRTLYGGCVIATAVGLLVLGFMPSYALIALLIFLLSFTGSPMGAIGQSIMLDMFPTKREKYMSIFAFFGAMGSLVAPLIVSLNYSVSLSWRWPFVEVAALSAVLFLALLFVRMPKPKDVARREKLLTIARNRTVVIVSALIFASVGADLGFSYWLAEYFKSELHASLPLSSSVVGVYLAGIIAGRLLISVFLKRMSARANLAMGLGVALACIFPFILVRSVALKIVLCGLYGFGIGPLFPLLVAQGSREFPAQSGAVTGILYAALSLGGMVFPLVVGAIAGRVGIAGSYFFCAGVVAVLLVGVVSWGGAQRRRAA